MAVGGSQQERREQWRNKIEQWRDSGLSVAEWCRRQGENYSLFLRWRRRFCDPLTGFLEIGRGSESGIAVEVGQARVRVHPHFDPVTLRRVVQALCSE